jgi:hypothetical protein
MVFLAQFSKSMKKYHVSILLGYYFKIFGEALSRFFGRGTTLICFGKVRLSHFVYGTALKSYIGGTDFSERQNIFFTRKWYFWHNFPNQ